MDNLEEMHRFLERYSLSRLNMEEIENMSRWITSTETVIQNFPIKYPGPGGFSGNSVKHLEILSTSCKKNCRGRNTPKLIL